MEQIELGDTFADLQIGHICVVNNIDYDLNMIELYYDTPKLDMNDRGCVIFGLDEFMLEVSKENIIKY